MKFSINLVIWAVIWLSIWGFFLLVMRKKGFSYLNNYRITSLYFLGASIVSIFIFKDVILPFVKKPSFIPIFTLLLVLFIFNPLVYWFARKFLKRPDEFISKNQGQFAMDYRYLVSKSFEILFQQLFVIILTLLLVGKGLSLGYIILTFAFIFGIFHIPLIWVVNRFWGLFYTSFAIISAVVFPTLITKVNEGFIYSYIVHWLFYTLAGLFFWIYFNRKFKYKNS